MSQKHLAPLFERYQKMLDDTADDMLPQVENCDRQHLITLCGMALRGIISGRMHYGKLCRWLGFIQGILCASEITTVEVERNFSRPIFNLNEPNSKTRRPKR